MHIYSVPVYVCVCVCSCISKFHGNNRFIILQLSVLGKHFFNKTGFKYIHEEKASTPSTMPISLLKQYIVM